MKEERVFSPILDKHLQLNMQDSNIWNNCFHEEDVEEKKTGYPRIYCYRIKFKGLTPVQLVELSEYKTK